MRCGRLVTAAVVLLICGPAGVVAQESTQAIGLGDVGRGCLLVASGAAGRNIEVPMLDTKVAITVKGLVAEAVVEQRFANTSDEWLEGVYVFPLPERAAVHDMRLVVGERVIVGQVKEREVARQVYATAKKAGTKASLVEQERPNIFTTSVANIGPGERIAVRLAYQETLVYDSGRFELRFPMVVGPRYIPGRLVAEVATGTGWAPDTDVVPDASRITPPVLHPAAGKINPVRLEISLDAGVPLKHLSSPSHPVEISADPSGVRRITLDGAFADRDFVLEWVPERGSEPRAAVFAEELDGAYYVLAMLMPPADEFLETVRLPRETVFVIDTSGSMGGTSIVQAKDALLLALDHLKPEDYFNIIEFDSSYTRFSKKSRSAMPANLDEAADWVNRLAANGGTEMAGPLAAALEDLDSPTPLRQVIFITDGCVGNEDSLMPIIKRGLGRSRLFTVGIGSAPNSHLMERAAEIGRGSFTYIGTPFEVAMRMGELFSKIENPVLADIELVWPDPDVETWPAQVPDLYAGEPVVVTARLGTLHGDLEASGVRADQAWRTSVPLAIRKERAGVNRLWARRKIAAIMDSRYRGVAESEVRDRVVEVALAHHLVSKYTSLVAVDVTPTRPQDAALKRGAVPTNLPAGWDFAKVFGALPQGATPGRLYLLTALIAVLAAAAVRGLRLVM